VIHHTELLSSLVRERRIRPTRCGESDGTITYHDSCSVARHNDLLDAPRKLVSAVGERVEDAALAQADLLLRRRRCRHMDGGARRADQQQRLREQRRPAAAPSASPVRSAP
jgi:hypothetical protein